jgi:hypothetical protein
MAADFVPGNDHLVHLIRAVHDTQRAGITPHQGKGRVVGNSHGAVHLDSAIKHVKMSVTAMTMAMRQLG